VRSAEFFIERPSKTTEVRIERFVIYVKGEDDGGKKKGEIKERKARKEE
jgi:hypothetical protein